MNVYDEVVNSYLESLSESEKIQFVINPRSHLESLNFPNSKISNESKAIEFDSNFNKEFDYVAVTFKWLGIYVSFNESLSKKIISKEVDIFTLAGLISINVPEITPYAFSISSAALIKSKEIEDVNQGQGVTIFVPYIQDSPLTLNIRISSNVF